MRRAAVAGFIAFGPDALFPLGGYPGNDTDGRRMQGERDRQEMTEDFVAAANFLINHDDCTGQVGAVGFCFGGGMVNTLGRPGARTRRRCSFLRWASPTRPTFHGSTLR